MTDRMDIINDALLATGNEALSEPYDGSDAWQVAESAYRRAINSAVSAHDWKFTTQTSNLASISTTNPSKKFDYAYVLPGGCLMVETAFLSSYVLNDYEIVDGKLCCDYNEDVSVKYVRLTEPNTWPPAFRELVTIKVEEIIFRAMNEDHDGARLRSKDYAEALERLKTRVDQQQPGQAIFRSRTASARAGARRVNRFWRHDGAP